jgi:hypothetical protein
MTDTDQPADPIAGDPRAGGVPLDPSGRGGMVLLQTLVTIVLSYQLLFSQGALVTDEARQFLVLGMLLVIAGLIVLPVRVVETRWFVGALVVADTAVTSVVIYLSGNASSDLFITYFLIILIAAFSASLQQMIGFSVLLCAAYGAILYAGFRETGALTEGHLLRIPVLLIMAAVYGVAVEMVRKERRQKAGLMDHIAALRQAEEEKERLIAQLQEALANVKTLSGLLPICFSCKQIRDDKGYWNQIETYIRDHTQAEFTHGICPACARKLYPDLYPGVR